MDDLDAETNTGKGVLGPRASMVFALVITLLLAALSGLVMRPAAQHLRSLQDGLQAEATLVAAGSGCFLGDARSGSRRRGGPWWRTFRWGVVTGTTRPAIV